MGTFNNLAIFIQGSRLYGGLDFANSILFVSVVFGQRQTWNMTNILNIGSRSHFWDCLFVMCRMSVLVHRSLNSVSSASLGVGSLLHPPLTICLNNSIQQVSNRLAFHMKDGIAHISLALVVMLTFWSVSTCLILLNFAIALDTPAAN